MDTEKIAAIRQRVDAVNAELPTVTDIDLLATVAGTDAEMLLDALTEAQDALRLWEKFVWYATGGSGHGPLTMSLWYAMVFDAAKDAGRAALAGRQEPARPAAGPGS